MVPITVTISQTGFTALEIHRDIMVINQNCAETQVDITCGFYGNIITFEKRTSSQERGRERHPHTHVHVCVEQTVAENNPGRKLPVDSNVHPLLYGGSIKGEGRCAG